MFVRVELQPAYILHSRPYRDTSLIVDVLSQQHGKISLVARGARKAKSRQRYLLQPFIPVLLSWQGKQSLKTLTAVEAQSSPLPLSGSLSGKYLYSALYVNELLAYLLPQDDPTTSIFQNYQYLLASLSDETSRIEPCLRMFEFCLLEELGYGVNFYENADTGDVIRENLDYFFIDNHGFVSTLDHPEIRDMAFLGKELLNIQQQNFYDELTLKSAKILARRIIKPHLRGRELKSRDLFTSLLAPPNST